MWIQTLAIALLAWSSGVLSQPPPPVPPPLRMANVFGDHMVLQQAPAQAIVWGYASKCDSKLSATFGEQAMTPTQSMDSSTGMCVWKLMLPATAADAKTAYKITITSDKYGMTGISDVMFGDVWICSGQSNMQFAVSQAFGGKDEIASAGEYPLIRLFTADLKYSETPQSELISVEQSWSVASPESVGGGDWKYFSATCWFFGKNMFKTLGYPIGLVATNWGGTRVEAWSSPQALSKCTGGDTWSLPKGTEINQNSPSALWNAMVVPFLSMTIKGAVWYQGEANSGSESNAVAYSCRFPAMIDDWRENWATGTDNQTTPLYFGFVQLAPTGNTNVTVGGFPQVRWSQTANFGYVPNLKMKDVFMAVAIDLGDPTSPYGSVHPRDKSDVGLRLSIGARAVAYNDATVNYLGMLPQKATLQASTNANITAIAVTYSPPKSAEDKLTLRYPYGFEVGCSSVTKPVDTQWVEGTALSVTETDVNVEFPPCTNGLKPMLVRYCWRTDPCTFNKCPVYSSTTNPSPPFIMDLNEHTSS